MNLKTKKKVHMYNYAGSVCVAANRVIVGTNSGAVGNPPIYSYKQNGTGKKKIADGNVMKVKNNKVYYYMYKEFGYTDMRYKVYTCSLTGKNKKAVTGWEKQYPSRYLE